MLKSREYLGEIFHSNNKNIKWLPSDRQWTKCPATKGAPSSNTDVFPQGRKAIIKL